MLYANMRTEKSSLLFVSITHKMEERTTGNCLNERQNWVTQLKSLLLVKALTKKFFHPYMQMKLYPKGAY